MRERRRRSIDDKISINERSNSAYLSRENAVRCSALERGGDFFPRHGGWRTKKFGSVANLQSTIFDLQRLTSFRQKST